MEFDLITLRIHVYRHGSSSLNGSLFWCRKKDEGQPLDSYEPLRQGERRRRCDLQESIAPHRAAGKKTYQRILMVFLVNSRHNESAVPPPEFLLSTPTLNIKISRISSLFSSLCRFLSTLCEDPRDTLSSFLSSLAVSSHVSLMITIFFGLNCPPTGTNSKSD